MITYICHNKNDKTGENLPCTNNRCETSICPSCGGRSDAISEIFWCPECQVPIYEKTCPVCGQEGKKLTSDVRPGISGRTPAFRNHFGKAACI